MISVHDIVTLFLTFCGGISIIGAAVVYAGKAIGWIRKPEQAQNSTLKDHEMRISKLEEKTNNDYDDIKTLQKEVKMMLQATLAIMKHELDGNHTEDLLKSQKSIENYLLNK